RARCRDAGGHQEAARQGGQAAGAAMKRTRKVASKRKPYPRRRRGLRLIGGDCDMEVELNRGHITEAEVDGDPGDGRGRWERQQFENGHKEILLFFLHEILAGRKRGQPYEPFSTVTMPEWVADALTSACQKVYGYEAASWDEVFGRPLKKGEQ